MEGLDLDVLFKRFGIALAIGLLIGLEREREKAITFAGIRTFPLIAILGCAAAMINELFVPLTFIVTMAILAAISLKSYQLTHTATSPGITTQVASLLAFLFGGLIWWELTAFVAAAAVVTVLLLAAKEPLERLSHHIGHEDIMAALQFGVITLIVLPLLPNRTFGPLDVLNPHTIWMMVILIAGVNLISYALVKILGSSQGIAVAGVLGGLGSSTALTIGFSRRSSKEKHLVPILGLAIVIASTIMFARILVIASSVNVALGRSLIWPMAVTMAVGLISCLILWMIERRRVTASEEMGQVTAANPFELWSAIQFGILFGIIILIAKAADHWIGSAGIYLSSFLAGLADVDAITLSLSNLVGNGSLNTEVGTQGILVAAMANTAMKAGIAIVLGSSSLWRYVLPAFLAMALAGLACVFLM